MTSYGNNPGWVQIWFLEVIYIKEPAWSCHYPTLAEAHAMLRSFQVNHSVHGIRKMQISEGRLKVTPFLTVDL